jgi:spermidine synthase
MSSTIGPSRRRVLAAGLAAGLTPLLPAGGVLAQTSEELIDSRESRYNNIYIYRRQNYISMTFGHNRRLYVESVFNTQDEGDLPVTYTRYMTVATAYSPGQARMLQIGLGGGRTSWYMHLSVPDMEVTVAELDPEVIALAQRYFRIRPGPKFNVVASDGRSYLMRNAEPFDMIFIDAYRGPFVPFHLLTREFYALVKQRLKPGGVVAQNVEPSTMLFDAAVVTMREAFPNLEFFPAEGNIVVVAYDGPARPQAEVAQAAQALQDRYRFRYPLPELLTGRRQLGEQVQGRVLTDDFAPVEALRAMERHNRKWDE